MTLEETIADLQRERDEFARRARESEDIRAAVALAAVDAGRNMVRALQEIEELQKVVDAAVKWRQSADVSAIGEHLNAARDLRTHVDAHIKRIGSRS